MKNLGIKIALSAALCGSMVAGSAMLQAQVAGSTPELGENNLGAILDEAYWEGTPAATDAATMDTTGAALNVVEGQLLNRGNQTKDAGKKLLDLARNKKLSPELRKEGLEGGKKLLEEGDELVKDAGFLNKVDRALKVINVVAIAAKGAAYIAEGDLNGAVGVIIQEGVKKGMEAGSSLFLGPVGGTIVGEGLFILYVKDELEAREDILRNQEFANKYLNKPWMNPTFVMDSKGNVRELAPDMYVEKGTGMIRRRSPEEQAAFEEGRKIRWEDGRTWKKLDQDFAEGKISKERYDQLREAYRNRNPLEKWDPDAVPVDDVALYAGSYSGSFSGGASGTVNFSVRNGSVSGTMRGTCKIKVCSGNAISATISGSVTGKGVMSARVSGKVIGMEYGSFGGSFGGMVSQEGGSGGWSGMNQYGGGDGRWAARRGN